MILKALTVHQPWAGLMAGSFLKTHNLLRRAEVRKWGHFYRGLLFIHAGLKIEKEACEHFGIKPSDCITRAIICSVLIVETQLIKDERTWLEMRYLHLEPGDRCYGDKTFVWLFDSPELLSKPIPCSGKLGLWNIPSKLHNGLSIR